MLRPAIAASLLCLSLAGAAYAQPRPATAPLRERDNVWAQTYVGRPADPAVRFGTLPNGMRYAVMRNATPTGETSLRLRIGAGSMDEAPGQEGLAHFLEHMAFKGSAHVAGDDMVKILERMGLAFGADTNAGTGFDETVYKLDLPRSSEADLSTALMLLRDQASALTLSQAAMDSERGVVLSEERLRDTPGYRSGKAMMEFLLEGQRAPTRWPIGDPQVLKTAPVSRIRAFYDAHYRPELATLVAIGDFDPAAMEAQIKARFSDWTGRGAAPPEPDRGSVKPRGLQVRLFVDPGVSHSVQINWVAPYDDKADTFAHERETFVRQLALAVLNRRLAKIGAAPDAPFVAAGAGRNTALHSAEVTALRVSTTPEGWRKGLTAALVEEQRLARFGVTQAELDREVAETRGALVSAAAGAATRRTPQIADGVVSSAGEDTVFTSPAQDLAEFERAVKGLTVAEVSAAGREIFTGSGPLVFVSAPKAPEGGEPAVLSAVQAALATAVTPPVREAALTWPYAHLGTPARVTERHEVKDLGVTFATLSNGVRVTVKPTQFRKDQVLVTARFGHGREGLPVDRPTPLWAARTLVVQGGTRELTYQDLDRAGAGRVVSAAYGFGDDSMTLGGVTRPADLEFQMQMLAAYLTRPGLRPEVFARTKAAAASMLDQVDSTPSGVLGRDFGVLSHGGDLRWQALPTRQELASTTLDQVKSVTGLPIGGEPLEVVIVGDVTVDRALKLAAETFGALPPRHGPAKPAARALETRFPAPGRVELLHKGRADQAVAMVAWSTTDLFADTQAVRALGMAAEILQLRLTDRLRVAEGATYSPAAQSVNSEVFPGYGYVYAQVETPPAKIDGFFAAADRIAAELATQGPSADEMQRAKAPRVEQRVKTQQTNEYWLSALQHASTDPRMLTLIRDLVPATERITAEDVRAAAARYLQPAKAWRIVVRAAEPAPGGPAQKPLPAGPPRPPVVKPSPPPAAPPSKTGSTTTTPSATPAAPTH